MFAASIHIIASERKLVFNVRNRKFTTVYLSAIVGIGSAFSQTRRPAAFEDKMKMRRLGDILFAENRQQLAPACGAISDASFWEQKPQNAQLWYQTANHFVDQDAKPQP